MTRKPWKIGIWGPTSAGKTVYLGMLYHIVKRRHFGTWNMHAYQENPITRQFTADFHKEMFGRGYFPDVTTETKVYQFEVTGYGRFRYGRLHGVITLSDGPGGVWIDESTERSDKYMTLAESDAVLCLIEPQPNLDDMYRDYLKMDLSIPFETNHGFYEHHVSSLFSGLRDCSQDRLLPGNILPQVFVFLVTKVDQDQHLWQRRRNPEKLFEHIAGSETMSVIKRDARHVYFEACSSIGIIESSSRAYLGPNMEYSKGRPKVLDVNNLKPYNVEGPVQRLLENLKVKQLWAK